MAVLLIAIATLFISVGLNRGTYLRTVSFLFTHLEEKRAGYGRTPFAGADHAAWYGDSAPMKTQLGNDLVQGPALGVQVGCTLNIHYATVTNLFFGLAREFTHEAQLQDGYLARCERNVCFVASSMSLSAVLAVAVARGGSRAP
jgi:hypothetical protein